MHLETRIRNLDIGHVWDKNGQYKLGNAPGDRQDLRAI